MTIPMALTASGRTGPPLDRLLARGCLLAATMLLRIPFSRLLATVVWCQQRTPQRATAQQAAEFIAAVTAAGRSSRGRVACLERSLAAALLGVLRRRRVEWCIGARLMPYAAHAWVGVAGHAVGEPLTDRPYLLLLRA